mmetsp:Transcript_68196/g.154350  ORF Transcript_68196/g.154350 Transcript_68196/m.154350 type:complete len:225 (+) Transcript_68196:982-1656(+)
MPNPLRPGSLIMLCDSPLVKLFHCWATFAHETPCLVARMYTSGSTRESKRLSSWSLCSCVLSLSDALACLLILLNILFNQHSRPLSGTHDFFIAKEFRIQSSLASCLKEYFRESVISREESSSCVFNSACVLDTSKSIHCLCVFPPVLFSHRCLSPPQTRALKSTLLDKPSENCLAYCWSKHPPQVMSSDISQLSSLASPSPTLKLIPCPKLKLGHGVSSVVTV